MKTPILICGGAGFIGTNLASRFLSKGEPVLVYDDLSRPGVENNLRWLEQTYGSLIDFQRGDIRDSRSLRPCVRRASAVFHFAAQTAVTTSLRRPQDDFEVNALGTLTLLEELRNLRAKVPLLYTSTNKVYGDLNSLALRKRDSRYEPQHPDIRANGVNEQCPLNFHSPYGCSKGAADQYVLDYARSYGLPNIVFRMSCIYGPHQFGTEDQGWVAHFVLQTMAGQLLTLYGDGMQVRDILYVDDLIEAMLAAQKNASRLAGRAFNIGGGIRNTTSLLELLGILGQLEGQAPAVRFDDWRVGDQRYYVSDTGAFQSATGWQPSVGVREGVSRLHRWLRESGIGAPHVMQRGVA